VAAGLAHLRRSQGHEAVGGPNQDHRRILPSAAGFSIDVPISGFCQVSAVDARRLGGVTDSADA
jgi:hypothetical protein